MEKHLILIMKLAGGLPPLPNESWSGASRANIILKRKFPQKITLDDI
jgi:hypothetical protein